MTGPQSRRLPDGRLHLQHGPIDLILCADGPAAARAAAAAEQRFATVLDELVAELPLLRAPTGPVPLGEIARVMHAATRPFRPDFITPMAAVAGAVAQSVLAALPLAGLSRAYVNNGGDIALHLGPGASFVIAVATPGGAPLARIMVGAADAPRGIATSGLGGRSMTLGIADAVTALASTAAGADAAATMIANAVNLPGHRAIRRVPARDLHPESDLGSRLVTTSVGYLADADIDDALANGVAAAETMRARGLIDGAALFLRGQSRIVGTARLAPHERIPEHA